MLLLLVTCSAWEINYIEIKNETISIIPIINICENTTTVFKIQRENYSINNSPIELNYLQKTKTNITKITNITKTINKYTKSNTGNYTINKNGNASLIFEIGNKSLEWNFSINCFKENITKNLNNNTINNTTNKSINITINKSINLTNNTSNNITNKSINKSTNITINISINITNNISNNNSENIKNNSIKNNTINCPKEFRIKTNKKIFLPRDKLKMQFLTDQWVENYKITYYIELLNGTIAKKQYTTTNNNTKTYTIKSSEQEEQTYKIIAKMESECKTLETEEIFVVKNQINKQAKEKTNISLEAEVKNEELQLVIEAKRGDSSKSLINIFLKNEKGEDIRDGIKIYLENKGSKAKLTLNENVSNEKIINVVAKGLGIYKELKIENKEYNKTIKQKIKSEKEEKPVEKTNKTKETKVTEKTNNLKKIPANIEVKKTSKIEATKQTNIKKSTNIMFTIALLSIIGIGSSIYLRKNSTQKNT